MRISEQSTVSHSRFLDVLPGTRQTPVRFCGQKDDFSSLFGEPEECKNEKGVYNRFFRKPWEYFIETTYGVLHHMVLFVGKFLPVPKFLVDLFVNPLRLALPLKAEDVYNFWNRPEPQPGDEKAKLGPFSWLKLGDIDPFQPFEFIIFKWNLHRTFAEDPDLMDNYLALINQKFLQGEIPESHFIQSIELYTPFYTEENIKNPGIIDTFFSLLEEGSEGICESASCETLILFARIRAKLKGESPDTALEYIQNTIKAFVKKPKDILKYQKLLKYQDLDPEGRLFPHLYELNRTCFQEDNAAFKITGNEILVNAYGRAYQHKKGVSRMAPYIQYPFRSAEQVDQLKDSLYDLFPGEPAVAGALNSKLNRLNAENKFEQSRSEAFMSNMPIEKLKALCELLIQNTEGLNPQILDVDFSRPADELEKQYQSFLNEPFEAGGLFTPSCGRVILVRNLTSDLTEDKFPIYEKWAEVISTANRLFQIPEVNWRTISGPDDNTPYLFRNIKSNIFFVHNDWGMSTKLAERLWEKATRKNLDLSKMTSMLEELRQMEDLWYNKLSVKPF